MKKKIKTVYLAIVVVLLMGLCLYFIDNRNSEKVAPLNTTENLPAIESAVPSKGIEEDSTKIDKKLLTPPISSEREMIERPPSLPPASHGESVNLEAQSYSIKNEKKEIAITPGVSLQPGKSVDVKIPGSEEVIRLQRDKTYHPGGYNVLWEKKY